MAVLHAGKKTSVKYNGEPFIDSYLVPHAGDQDQTRSARRLKHSQQQSHDDEPSEAIAGTMDLKFDKC